MDFTGRFLSQQNTHSPESFHCSSSFLWFSCQRTPTLRSSRNQFSRPTTENCALLTNIWEDSQPYKDHFVHSECQTYNHTGVKASHPILGPRRPHGAKGCLVIRLCPLSFLSITPITQSAPSVVSQHYCTHGTSNVDISPAEREQLWLDFEKEVNGQFDSLLLLSKKESQLGRELSVFLQRCSSSRGGVENTLCLLPLTTDYCPSCVISK